MIFSFYKEKEYEHWLIICYICVITGVNVYGSLLMQNYDNNLKLVTNKKINNYNNKLSLKESSYFIKFDKKGSLYLNKDNKNYCDLNMNYLN